MKYGQAPISLGRFDIRCTETMFYQSMPVKLPEQKGFALEPRLERFRPLLDLVRHQYLIWDWMDKYVYLTAQHRWVGPGSAPNRPGWHSDGYLTQDCSYLWFDSVPTVYNTSAFSLSPSHSKSLEEMRAQADPDHDHEAPCFELLKFDPSVIHAVGQVQEPGMRTFIKIVVSDRQYNLVGNTRNPLLHYYWDEKPRSVERNDPSK